MQPDSLQLNELIKSIEADFASSDRAARRRAVQTSRAALALDPANVHANYLAIAVTPAAEFDVSLLLSARVLLAADQGDQLPQTRAMYLEQSLRAAHAHRDDDLAADVLSRLAEAKVFPRSMDASQVLSLILAGSRLGDIEGFLCDQTLTLDEERLLLHALRECGLPAIDVVNRAASHGDGRRVASLLGRNDLASRSDVSWMSFRETSEIVRLPIMPQLADFDRFGEGCVVTLPLSIARFEQAELVSGSGAVELSDGHVYCEYVLSAYARHVSPLRDPTIVFHGGNFAALTPRSTPSVRFEEAISMMTPMGLEHGHLMADMLPRFEAIERAGLPRDIPVLIAYDPQRPHGAEWYRRCSSGRPVLEIPWGERVQVDVLFAPMGRVPIPPHLMDWSLYGPDLSMPTPQGIAYVRDRIRISTPRLSGYPRRVFLDRSSYPQHSLSNEAEFMEAAVNRGYLPIDPATMDVGEQIELFSSAQRVAGNFGSAFCNGALAPRGASYVGVLSCELAYWARGQSAPYGSHGIDVRILPAVPVSHDGDAHAATIVEVESVLKFL